MEEKPSTYYADTMQGKEKSRVMLYSELWARNAYGCKTKNVYILAITQ